MSNEEVSIERSEAPAEVIDTPNLRRRVVLTIRPTTETIRLILVAPRYDHHGEDSPEETEHERYFYEEHTCPSNWLRDIVRVEVGEDHDPHGFVELTEVANFTLHTEGQPWLCEGCMCGMPGESTRPKPDRCEECGAKTAALTVARDG